MSPSMHLVKVSCLAALVAGLAALPASAMCLGGGNFLVTEVKVLSCQPSASRLDQALAKEAAEAKEEGEAAEPAAAKWREFQKGRAGRMRPKAANVVLLEVRSIRDRVFPKDPRRDPSAKGVWEETKIQEPRWILLQQARSADCAGLTGSKIHMISAMPCCDVFPSDEIACVVNLWQGSLAPAELVGNLD